MERNTAAKIIHKPGQKYSLHTYCNSSFSTTITTTEGKNINYTI